MNFADRRTMPVKPGSPIEEALDELRGAIEQIDMTLDDHPSAHQPAVEAYRSLRLSPSLFNIVKWAKLDPEIFEGIARADGYARLRFDN